MSEQIALLENHNQVDKEDDATPAEETLSPSQTNLRHSPRPKRQSG